MKPDKDFRHFNFFERFIVLTEKDSARDGEISLLTVQWPLIRSIASRTNLKLISSKYIYMEVTCFHADEEYSICQREAVYLPNAILKVIQKIS